MMVEQRPAPVDDNRNSWGLNTSGWFLQFWKTNIFMLLIVIHMVLYCSELKNLIHNLYFSGEGKCDKNYFKIGLRKPRRRWDNFYITGPCTPNIMASNILHLLRRCWLAPPILNSSKNWPPTKIHLIAPLWKVEHCICNSHLLHYWH